MRVIIAGGREVPYKKAMVLVGEAVLASGWANEITEIVEGGAKGIDNAAKQFFTGVLPIKTFPADWDTHGKLAGPIRNRQMAENADALIACWNQKSVGTKNMIDTATKFGLRVFVYLY